MRLGIRTLPVTFLVLPSGRAAYRFDGARDWSDETFLRSWIGALEPRGGRPPAAAHLPAPTTPTPH